MARPKTSETTLKAIFDGIQKGEKSKAIAEALDHTVSVSLIADMRNGWAHTELGKTYGIEPKVRKPKAPKTIKEIADNILEGDFETDLIEVVTEKEPAGELHAELGLDPEADYEFDEEFEDEADEAIED